jgi:flavonoid 3'-monooxygenase
MFTAGTDTSSSTVEWAIAELIRHPKILAQVQKELDSVVGRDRFVSVFNWFKSKSVILIKKNEV